MFDVAKFLEALTGGVFKTALKLAVEKAGGTCGEVRAIAGGLGFDILDGEAVVDRVHLGMADKLWLPVSTEAERKWEASPAARALPGVTAEECDKALLAAVEDSGWAGRTVPFLILLNDFRQKFADDLRIAHKATRLRRDLDNGCLRITHSCELKAAPGVAPMDLLEAATPPRLSGYQRQLNVSQDVFRNTLYVVCTDTETKLPDVGPDP